MLVLTKFSPNDVVTLKLQTGEELVARYQKETDTHITLDKVTSIMASPQGIGLGPFLMTAQIDDKGFLAESLDINKSSVIAIIKTSSMFATKYSASISGIQVAGASATLNGAIN